MTIEHQAQLAERALPSPSGSVQRVLQLLSSEAATTLTIAQAVGGDPAMTGRVIRLANSAVYGGRRAVANLHEALRRIGLNALRQVLITFSLVDRYRDGHCQDFDYQAFWAQSLATGIISRHLAALERLPGSGDAFSMGLLARIGELGLASLHPDDYGGLHASLADASPAAVRAAETGRYGCDRFQLAERLLQDWQLPETLVQAVRGSTDPAHAGLLPQSMAMRLARLLQIARLLGRSFETGDRAPVVDLPAIRALCLAARVPVDELSALLPEIILEWREWAAQLELIVRGTGPVTLDVPQRAEVIPFPSVSVVPANEVSPAQGTPDGQEPATSSAGSPRSTAFVAAVRRMQGGGRSLAPEAPAEAPGASAAVSLPDPRLGDVVRRALPAGPLRLLVAMPESPARAPILALLESQGHAVRSASSGSEALADILREVPQVVLCDASLRDIDALQLIHQLRDYGPLADLYVIASGPRQPSGLLEAAFGAGADDYLPMPVQAGELLGRLRAARRFVDVQTRWRADHAEMRRLASELTVLNARLESAVESDPLTGLPNRRRGHDALAVAVERAGLAARPLCAFLVELDHFQQIGEQHGHAAAEQVLGLAARTLQACARSQDLVARIGDALFLVIAPGIDGHDAAGLAERMRAAVNRLRIDTRTGEIAFTVSVGVGSYEPRPGQRRRTPETLLHLADEALYRARDSGRNRVCIAAERQPVV